MVLDKPIRFSAKTKAKLIEFGKKGETYDDTVNRLLDIAFEKTENRKIIVSKETEPRKKKKEEITISEEDMHGTWDAEKAKKMGW